MATKRQTTRRVSKRINAITVSKSLAGPGDEIQVEIRAQPGGRARFSIAQVLGAQDIPLIERPEKPGTYSGAYKVQAGENTKNAPVSVVLIAASGETACSQARQRVTLDTNPPRAPKIAFTPAVLSNGKSLRLTVTCETGCQVIADLNQLDSTRRSLPIPELPGSPGRYQRSIRISPKNEASNGRKNIEAVAIDAAGNKSEPAIAEVELRNSELHFVRGVTPGIGTALNRAELMALADLRRIEDDDLRAISAKTRVPAKELEHFRAAAKLQAIGLDADLSNAMVRAGNVRSPAQLALMSREHCHLSG